MGDASQFHSNCRIFLPSLSGSINRQRRRYIVQHLKVFGFIPEPPGGDGS